MRTTMKRTDSDSDSHSSDDALDALREIFRPENAHRLWRGRREVARKWREFLIGKLDNVW